MIIQYFEIKKLPLLIIDNFFTHDESKQILQELVDLDNRLTSDDSKIGSAWKYDEYGIKRYTKNARGRFLDEIYEKDREKSIILNITRKIFDMNFLNHITKMNYFFRYIAESNADNTIAHYYEDGGYYDFHVDRSVISVLSWHFFEPKKFLGGNLIIDPDYKLEIEPENRKIVILPSILFHKVENVIMNAEDKNKNLGRYSIAQFIKSI